MNRLYKLLMVRESERNQVGYFVTIFLAIGAGLALGRGSMDALFLKRYGFEYLPVMYAVLSVVLATVSLAYAAWADRIASEKFIRIMLVVLAGVLVVNWSLIGPFGAELAYPLYFLVYEVASELLLLHAALYLSQNFDTVQARRVTPLIFAAAQIGTIIGGLLLAGLSQKIGVQNVLLVWSMLLLMTLLLVGMHHHRHGLSPYFQPVRRHRGGLKQSFEQVLQGLHFTRDSRLLRAASLALFFMVISFYILCYSINRIYATSFTSEQSLSTFLGMLTAATSALTLLVQILVTGRLLNRIGLQRTNLVFPASGLVTYGFLLFSFALPAALIGSIARDVLMPAIRRPTRNLFFNALPDYMQGRTRALAVALVLPLALLVASGILVLTQNAGNPAWFLVPGALAGLAYLWYALRMNRAYLDAMLASLRERLFIPGRHLDTLKQDGGPELIGELSRGVTLEDDELAVGYARMLMDSHPGQANGPVIDRLRHSAVPTRDRLLHLLACNPDDRVIALCHEQIGSGDEHLRASAATILFDLHDPAAASYVAELMESSNPRLVATAIRGAYRLRIENQIQRADDRWRELLDSTSRGANLSGLELFTRLEQERLLPSVLALLDHDDARVESAALRALSCWPCSLPESLAGRLDALSTSLDPSIRELCVRCYRRLPEHQSDRLALKALEDGHPRVRDAALEVLDDGTSQFPDLLAAMLIGNAGSPRAQKAILMVLMRAGMVPSVFTEIARCKASDARELSRARQALAGFVREGATLNLLATVVQERREQVIDLALMAMERCENPDTMQTIRAGLRSRDNRQVANACEALRNLQHRDLATSLGTLLEDAGDQPGAMDQTMTIEEVLGWCERRPDPWLRQCVQFTRNTLTGQHRVGTY